MPDAGHSSNSDSENTGTQIACNADCLSGTDLCAATGMGETLMDNNQEAIRKLTQAMNRIDGLYYQAARKLGVKSNTLAIFYALDDGQSHSQKAI